MRGLFFGRLYKSGNTSAVRRTLRMGVLTLIVLLCLVACGQSSGEVRKVAGVLSSDSLGKTEKFDEEAPKRFAFGTNILREQISSVQFMSSLPSDAEEEGWDVSKNGDGTIRAWFKKNSSGYYDMTIAADGTIEAPIDCSDLFGGYTNMRSISFNGVFDTCKTESMKQMFRSCKSMISADVETLDVAMVTDMYLMFSECSFLSNLDVSRFNTSKVADMSSMFHGCSSLKTLDVSGFDTALVTSMYGMFYNCSSLTSLDVSGFNTSKVTTMRSMFQDCSSLKTLDVSGFNTSKVNNMYAMFYNCSSLESLDVSGFDTSSVTDMSYLFGKCPKLKLLNLTNWDISAANEFLAMFNKDTETLKVDYPANDEAWKSLIQRDDLGGNPRFVGV